MDHQIILILDFGSQYTQLIARRIRELHVFSEIRPHTLSAAEVQKLAPEGIVLSGGPASCYDEGAPELDPGVLEAGLSDDAADVELPHGLPALPGRGGGEVNNPQKISGKRFNLSIFAELLKYPHFRDFSS